MREISSVNERPLLSDSTGPRPLLPPGSETEYVYSSATDEVHLRDYWKTVVKRRRLITIITVLSVVIGAYVTFTATPLYIATSVLKIEPQSPTVTDVPQIFKTEDGGFDYYQTEFKLLESRVLAAKVIADSALDSNESFTRAAVISSNAIFRIRSAIFGNLQYVINRIASLVAAGSNKPPTQISRRSQPIDANLSLYDQGSDFTSYRWVGRYLSFLRVSPVKGTRLVELQFTTPDPDLSQFLANAHARAFIRMNLETRSELTKEAREFLDAKNAELKLTLERSEDKLNRYRKLHGVVSMEKGENIVVDRLVDSNRQLTAARAQRIEAESLYRTVENKPPQYLSQVVTQGLVPTLRGNLQALEGERIKLSSTFKPDHPRMIELNQQINEMRRSLNIEIANVVKGIAENYAAARAKESAVQAEADKQQKLALDLKEVGVEYAVLDEEVKVNRTLYQNVLSRLHQTNVANDLALSNMQITQRAEKPDFPTYPDSGINFLLSTFFGLFVGVSLAFFLEYLDSSVSTPEHVWRAVGLSTFGVVPDLNSLKPDMLAYGRRLLSHATFLRLPAPPNPPRELIVAHHPLSIVTESYRAIRTALLFSQAETPPKVILLTSPSPDEGKTITTLNLAVALVQDGYKVLVVDADFRKGSCHTRLDLKNHRGLSNILTGQLALADGIQQTAIDGLSFLSRGVCPPNPGELLGSSKMREVLRYLRESYNFILIDSPPAIAVSDAAILSVVSDGVLLVLHGKKTTTTSVRQAVQRLDSVRAPILGVILNGIDVGNPDYAYYRHYYGSDYGVIEEETNGYRKDGFDGGNGFKPGQREKPKGDLSAAAEKNDHEQEDDVADIRNGFESVATQFAKGSANGDIASRECFDYLVSRLAEDIGPMAVFIVKEHVSLLGESMEGFPKSRLNELVKRVSNEILDTQQRQNFHNAVAQELSPLLRA